MFKSGKRTRRFRDPRRAEAARRIDQAFSATLREQDQAFTKALEGQRGVPLGVEPRLPTDATDDSGVASSPNAADRSV